MSCTQAARRTVSSLSALVALLELVVSIVTSAYCCFVIGTGTQAKPTTVVSWLIYSCIHMYFSNNQILNDIKFVILK